MGGTIWCLEPGVAQGRGSAAGLTPGTVTLGAFQRRGLYQRGETKERGNFGNLFGGVFSEIVKGLKVKELKG